MKKRIVLIVVLCALLALSACLAACHKEPVHQHTYSEEWTTDDNAHWHAATCEHTEMTSDWAQHTLVHGKCTVCQKQVFTEQAGFEVYSYTAPSGNEQKVMEDVPATVEKLSLALHYKRNDAQTYKTWGYWLWADGADGTLVNIQYQDDFGSVMLVELDKFGGADAKIGLIPRLQSDWVKDCDADRFVVPSQFPLQDNCYHVYIVEGDVNLYKSREEIQYVMSATFTSETQINMKFSSPVKNVVVRENDTVLNSGDITPAVRVGYKLSSPVDLSKQYTVQATFVAGDKEKTVSVAISSALYGTESFVNNFTYDGDDLGATLGTNSTTFKVWSPVSSSITLNLYDSGDGGQALETHPMEKGEKGVWQFTANQRLDGKYYTYTVVNSAYPDGQEIVDPYARSAGLSGKRGMVVDFQSDLAKPQGWDDVQPFAYDPNELVVWETHVADVTSSKTWGGPEKLAKTFLGMIEPGTTYTDGSTTVKTGFDHIVELGVNAVQLVPVFDQANDESNLSFNWGYNPLNYNVPEGGYSTNASDGYVRVKELRQLVQAFNVKGINIIMDVVYNHVSAASGSNFDVLMPGYYFRYSNGTLANGSGCGNETASERPMMRKFIIDSVCFWAQTYKLGGFRFDLMGLHDIETMNLLTAKLKQIYPGIVVYGEPWTAGTSPLAESQQAKQSNLSKFEGYGQFNDQLRDALIKGGMNSADKIGWVALTDGFASQATRTDEVIKITNGLKGITGLNVNNYYMELYKTVNYVTCHDNYTLKDRITAIGNAEITAHAKQSAMLANSVVLTGNGISFMLAGEEFLRSKADLATDAPNDAKEEAVHNSYESSYEMNSLDYSLKITNADMFQNYCKLVEFKKMFVDVFGLTDGHAAEQRYNVAASQDGMQFVVTITAKDGKTWKVAHCNGVGTSETVDFAGYTLFLNTAGSTTLTAATKLAPFQTLVAYK